MREIKIYYFAIFFYGENINLFPFANRNTKISFP